MNGGVDLARKKGRVDLLGEKALASDVRQRPVLDQVASGADDFQTARPGSQPSACVRRWRVSSAWRVPAGSRGAECKGLGRHGAALLARCARCQIMERQLGSPVKFTVVQAITAGHCASRRTPHANRTCGRRETQGQVACAAMAARGRHDSTTSLPEAARFDALRKRSLRRLATACQISPHRRSHRAHGVARQTFPRRRPPSLVTP